MVGNMARPVDSMIMGRLLHFSDCKVSFLVKSNTVWNPWWWIRHSMDGGFDRNITWRKHKSMTRISIYLSKDKALPFPQRKWSWVLSLPPCHWLVTQGEWIVPYLGFSVGVYCWKICHWAVPVSSQLSLGGYKSMLWNTCITPISATMATLFIGTLGNDSKG